MLVKSLKATGKRSPEDMAVTGSDDESSANPKTKKKANIQKDIDAKIGSGGWI